MYVRKKKRGKFVLAAIYLTKDSSLCYTPMRNVTRATGEGRVRFEVVGEGEMGRVVRMFRNSGGGPVNVFVDLPPPAGGLEHPFHPAAAAAGRSDSLYGVSSDYTHSGRGNPREIVYIVRIGVILPRTQECVFHRFVAS